MALPRDPFFLVTHDGGQTWQDRPVFDEGRIGTITEFWFDDKSNGQLALDHTRKPENGNQYELHETATGGDTWSPKLLSPKPVKVAHSRAGTERCGLRRLNPDAKTKTTARRNRAWRKSGMQVAAFPIHVGDCKPPEVKIEPQQ